MPVGALIFPLPLAKPMMALCDNIAVLACYQACAPPSIPGMQLFKRKEGILPATL